MKTSEIILVAGILAGSAALIMAYLECRKIKKHFLKNLSIKWTFNKYLIVSLLIGYVCGFIFLSLEMKPAFNSVVGAVLLVTAGFIYRSVLLFKKTFNRLHREISTSNANGSKKKSSPLVDDLTGLQNRRGVFTLIDNHLKLAKRQKKRVLLLYADIDNLKGVNDRLGFQEGDLMLQETAKVLKSTFRESDLVARIGEDEFMVFPVGATDEHVDTISNSFQKNLQAHNMKRTNNSRLSVSTVVVPFDPEYNDSIDGMLLQANELMTEHKRHKRANMLAAHSSPVTDPSL